MPLACSLVAARAALMNSCAQNIPHRIMTRWFTWLRDALV